MVKTRSASLREIEREAENTRGGIESVQDNGIARKNTEPSSSIKLEVHANTKVPSITATSKSKRSTVSIEARKKQLILDAEREKAKIKMQLIDAQLETDLANLDVEEYSSQRSESCTRRNVENWMEQSQTELDRHETAPVHGHPTGDLLPPAVHTNTATEGTIQMLTSAVKNFTATTNQRNSDARLLSRLCTPKDLPEFSGDPLEWLQFKRAYEESTEVCNFSPKENLWRLRKCLHGKAKESVSALLISATSSEQIMATLELQYGNPDIIITRLMQDMKRLQSVSPEYQKDIVPFSVKVQNFVEAVRAIDRKEYLQGMSILSLILSKLPTVLMSKWSDYSFPLLKSNTKPSLELLSEFLTNEAIKTTSTTANLHDISTRLDSNTYRNNKHGTNVRSQTVLLQTEYTSSKCQFCRMSVHKLHECKQFRKALRKVRWAHVKRYGVCFKCLETNHSREECTAPACDKEQCGQAHYKLLHYPMIRSSHGRGAESARPREEDSNIRSVSTSTETVTHISAKSRKVLLKVVPVRLYTGNSYINTSALLDDGSTVTLISAELAARAGLCGRRETLRVCGPWSNNEIVCDTTILDLRLSGLDNKVFSVKARSVCNLDLPLQTCSVVNCDKYVYLKNIKNELCNFDVKPQILIGQDNHNLLLPLKILSGLSNEPSATLTALGWSIHGCVQMTRTVRAPRALTLDVVEAAAESSLLVSAYGNGERATSEFELHEEVRHYFEVESMGVAGKPRCNANDVHAVNQVEQTACLEGGRWQVGLPWKDPSCVTPADTFTGAFNRLKGVERKMAKDPPYAERYVERVSHLFDNSYARELTDTQRTDKTWYLPHFGVDNPNKRKLRLVFDAADKSSGLSLNDYLLKGPDLLNSLLDIMLRFRENKIALMGDIKDMFLRIKILPRDQDAFRFLWRANPTEPLRTFVMTSLLFGASCSPFVAQYIKNKNALRFQSTMPSAVDAIIKSHYMDDYIQSLPDEASALEMQKNICYIHEQGGFSMVNWVSNSPYVLQGIPTEALGSAAVKLKIEQHCDGERTLGLIWFPSSDELAFDLSFKRIPDHIISGKEKPTKRIMLRVIMSIFDVLGFLAPFTIQGKIMLQDTWRINSIKWDDRVPDDIFQKWCEWIELLKTVSTIRMPRWYMHATKCTTEVGDIQVSAVATDRSHRSNVTNVGGAYATDLSSDAAIDETVSIKPVYINLELHVFCDASQKALCAVAYWRWVYDSKVHVSFVASKCRVAPVKTLTVPRLELQAALLGARLAHTITTAHNIKPVRRFFWCDSTTVLHWLRNNTRTYKTFEANRLGEIDEYTSVSEWRYIATSINVADIATRDVFDYKLFTSEWLWGPTFLYSNEASWPRDILQPASDDMNLDVVGVVRAVSESLPVPDSASFSSWLRLLRATAMVLKFIYKCRRSTDCYNECEIMQRAELLLLKQAQMDSFGEEVALLRNGRCIRRDSRLRNLTPYIDEDGVLRVRGRIDAAPGVSDQIKRPIILDGTHATAKLLIMHFHVKAAHGNREKVVNDIKQKYWMVKIRPAVKNVTSKCLFCRIRKAKPDIPRMGNLPRARLEHHQRPFTYCGIDLFGPLEVTVCRRREKRYGVLFTCLTVRAIHIEVVHSLTTDALIMALRRMAARRGWPRQIYSDNGTNLRGADTELRKSIQDLNQDVLRSEAANYSTQWVFIPPASPHWGGAWERLIRSVKTSLRAVLKERAPRDEMLLTLLSEVEAIVNGRPLTHVSVEPGSSESLTPNHFLIGSSSSLPVMGVFDSSDLFLRKQWRAAQALADRYWQRWLKEYLPELVRRPKWHSESKPLSVGDFVVIVDPDSPRNVWPKGIIDKVFPGTDGRVRVVEVRTASGTLRRSAARIAPVPLVSASTGVGNVTDGSFA